MNKRLIQLSSIVLVVVVFLTACVPGLDEIAAQCATEKKSAGQIVEINGAQHACPLSVSATTAAEATPAPDATAAPDATTPSTDGDAETFTYVPGGPNYAWPDHGVEDLGDGWTRIRRNANGQYNAWTFLTRVRCDRQLEDQLQWDSAAKLNIFGPVKCRIEIKRDMRWADDLKREHPSEALPADPYTVANAKNSPLGLGWFITGVGSAKVNGTDSVKLSGPGVKQLAFPHDWEKTWVIDLEVPENGLVVLNQGEKITEPDNWTLP